MQLPFELDPQIIHHIIYSQAGSIGKALIELLMNSVDARATSVYLHLSREGFTCRDNGQGFASRDDVINYFGRFGTPHQEGDATYGRFRLGRGQIMAHARTHWRSVNWQMQVDTREMGYNYELNDLAPPCTGCAISGEWYEPLSDAELMSSIQELRDLVRYTPVSVTLNERVITRKPESEKWDAEDDFAWYRLREDGAVSIYNQGVLVRHDPGHMWGVGGLIVSKQAIALNVSRTEILRKTCPVWGGISAHFGKLAAAMTGKTGEHRKTESRREKTARALLAGEGDLVELYSREEVITLLPGKKHVTLGEFLQQCRRFTAGGYEGCYTVADGVNDVPRGELIAGAGIAAVVHPLTLTRFGCYSVAEFNESLVRIHENLRAFDPDCWYSSRAFEPAVIDFDVLSDAFVERTEIVSEKHALDAETRRAWVALRWCLYQYARRCTGGRDGYAGSARGGKQFNVLLGTSTSAEAWTDGQTYIACNVAVVRRLRTDPLRTAGYIFSLIEHEVAHEGDSLDCGHDEAFYQRFHDISISMADVRQRYIHIWMMKYTKSLEKEGKKAAGKAWQARYLSDRLGNGREKRGLPRMIEDVELFGDIQADVPQENLLLIARLNAELQRTHDPRPDPDWDSVKLQGILTVLKNEEAAHTKKRARGWILDFDDADGESDPEWSESRQDREDDEASFRAHLVFEEQEKERMALLLNIDRNLLTERIFYFLWTETGSDDDLIAAWNNKRWEHGDEADDHDMSCSGDSLWEEEMQNKLPKDWEPYLRPGETRWMIERNAVAAGFTGYFHAELNYLKWRAEQEADEQAG